MPEMKDIAKLFGKEINEECTFKGYEKNKYKFNDYILLVCLNGKWVECNAGFNDILKRKIIKIPPSYGNMYWRVSIDGEIFRETWVDNTSDYAFYAIGNCFHTKEEAQIHGDEIINKLKSIYRGECEHV